MKDDHKDVPTVHVAMEISPKDRDAAAFIERTIKAANKAAAVSFALQLTAQILRNLEAAEARLYVDTGRGTRRRVAVPGVGDAVPQLARERG